MISVSSRLNFTKPWIVFITQISHQKGTGHFKRCMALSYFINSLNFYSICILKNSLTFKNTNQSIPFFYFKTDQEEIQWLNTYSTHIKLIILDLGDIPSPQYKNMNIPLLSFDNLGTSQSYIDYLVEGLPNLQEHSTTPFRGEEFLFISDQVWEQSNYAYQKKDQIIISFGGSDPFDLSFFLYQIFLQQSLFKHCTYIFVLGMLYKGKLNSLAFVPPFVKIKNPDHLYPLIQESSLLITSFGITPFEAQILNTPVLLVNHTAYHQNLAKQANFKTLNITGEDLSQPNSTQHLILESIMEIKKIQFKNLPHTTYPLSPYNKILKSLLQYILTQPLICCPQCQGRNLIILGRTNQQYRIQCQDDNVIFIKQISFTLKSD